MTEKRSLETVLRELYAHEINIEIAGFYDSGWTVRIGDEMNGYRAEREFAGGELHLVGTWLEQEMRRRRDDPTPADYIIPVGKVIGREVDPDTLEPLPPKPAWMHFRQCTACGGWMDKRDLGQVTHHARADHRPMTDPDWDRVKAEAKPTASVAAFDA
jgi:hypothetical protein